MSKISPELLASDIKKHLDQGYSLDKIKTDALKQGILTETWNKAVEILNLNGQNSIKPITSPITPQLNINNNFSKNTSEVQTNSQPNINQNTPPPNYAANINQAPINNYTQLPPQRKKGSCMKIIIILFFVTIISIALSIFLLKEKAIEKLEETFGKNIVFDKLEEIVVKEKIEEEKIEEEKIEEEEIKSEEKKDLKHGFMLENDKIYTEEKKEIQNADIETFEALEKDISKDKNNIYYKDKKILEIDIETAKYLGAKKFEDKKGFYLINKSGEIETTGIKRIKSETPETPETPKDAKLLENPDTETLVEVKQKTSDNFKIVIKYSKDKNNVYADKKKLEGISPIGFEIINANYIKDKNNVFLIYKDNNTKELKTEIINKVDAKTFKLGLENLLEDANNIYYEKKGTKITLEAINDVDMQTFKFIKSDQAYKYFKDIKNVYFWNTNINKLFIIQQADPNLFKVLSKGFSMDKNNIYKEGIFFKSLSNS